MLLLLLRHRRQPDGAGVVAALAVSVVGGPRCERGTRGQVIEERRSGLEPLGDSCVMLGCIVRVICDASLRTVCVALFLFRLRENLSFRFFPLPGSRSCWLLEGLLLPLVGFSSFNFPLPSLVCAGVWGKREAGPLGASPASMRQRWGLCIKCTHLCVQSACLNANSCDL